MENLHFQKSKQSVHFLIPESDVITANVLSRLISHGFCSLFILRRGEAAMQNKNIITGLFLAPYSTKVGRNEFLWVNLSFP